MSKRIRILLVEDDSFKEKHIAQLVQAEVPHVELLKARSVVSCLTVIEQAGELDLVILDMSLPTYDVGSGESGGRPQGFGGQTVLHHLDAESNVVPVVVVTQFERFGDEENPLDLNSLRERLETSFAKNFKGLIFYSGSGEKWRQELSGLIKQNLSEGRGA